MKICILHKFIWFFNWWTQVQNNITIKVKKDKLTITVTINEWMKANRGNMKDLDAIVNRIEVTKKE